MKENVSKGREGEREERGYVCVSVVVSGASWRVDSHTEPPPGGGEREVGGGEAAEGGGEVVFSDKKRRLKS
jgi:hypothetical protein